MTRTETDTAVIIPTYNSAPFVGEAVESVLAQTSPPREIIVVDDGSQDDTMTVLDGFGSRIRVLRHDKNRGPGAARNTGIRNSSATLVCFLDADDVWEPQMTRRQLSEFDRHDGLGLCYTRLLDCDVHMTPIKSPREYPRRSYERVFDELYLTAFKITTSTVFARREAMLHSGLFDESLGFAEDYECWLRVSMRYPISCIPEALCRKRIHNGALTSQIHFKKRIADEKLCFELCARAARAIEIPLPMPLAERQILGLRRRLRQLYGYGDLQGGRAYRAELEREGRFSWRDRMAVGLHSAIHRLKSGLKGLAE